MLRVESNSNTFSNIYHFNHKFVLPGIDIDEDFRKADDLDIEDNGLVTRIKLSRHKKGIRTLQFMKTTHNRKPFLQYYSPEIRYESARLRLSIYQIKFVTDRLQSMDKVMFSQACVILFAGGGGGSGTSRMQPPPPQMHPPPSSGCTPLARRQMVNRQSVRFLLE